MFVKIGESNIATMFIRKRYILHADLDAFYASVEQKDDVSLRGQPVVVGGSPENRGVVMAASYEARQFGIHSALPMIVAIRRCPNLIRVSPNFERYKEMSRKIMEIFNNVTSLVEPLSLDEAYLDMSRIMESGIISVDREARQLKEKVRKETGLAITIGGGTSKSVAKIASQVAKPDGLLLIMSGKERDFLNPLDVGMLWGIGPKTTQTLSGYNIRTIGDLTSRDEAWLVSILGRRGLELRSFGMGIDAREVISRQEPKSISAENTLSHDVGDESTLIKELAALTKTVCGRLREAGLQGKTVHIKLRLADFTTFSRQVTLNNPTSDKTIIFGVARQLLLGEIKSVRLFRLIGIGISNFQGEYKPALF